MLSRVIWGIGTVRDMKWPQILHSVIETDGSYKLAFSSICLKPHCLIDLSQSSRLGPLIARISWCSFRLSCLLALRLFTWIFFTYITRFWGLVKVYDIFPVLPPLFTPVSWSSFLSSCMALWELWADLYLLATPLRSPLLCNPPGESSSALTIYLYLQREFKDYFIILSALLCFKLSIDLGVFSCY